MFVTFDVFGTNPPERVVTYMELSLVGGSVLYTLMLRKFTEVLKIIMRTHLS